MRIENLKDINFADITPGSRLNKAHLVYWNNPAEQTIAVYHEKNEKGLPNTCRIYQYCMLNHFFRTVQIK